MAFSVCTELMNISFCLLLNTGESICRNLLENIGYDFVFTSAVASYNLLVFFGWFARWEVNGHTTAFFVGCCIRSILYLLMNLMNSMLKITAFMFWICVQKIFLLKFAAQSTNTNEEWIFFKEEKGSNSYSSSNKMLKKSEFLDESFTVRI